VLRGLEEKKLIKRVQKIDERSKNPQLTQYGNEILAQALPAVERADTAFFETLATTEEHELVKAFQKLMRI
jgi:DNA-binding MarR family transcriptional regulator